MITRIGVSLACAAFLSLAFHAPIEAADRNIEQIHRTGRDLQDINKRVHRDHIENAVRNTAHRPVTVTSRDRIAPPSVAHDRGAIDIRSNNVGSEQRHREAKEYSKNLGRNYTTVVEEVSKDRRSQTDTAYSNGQRGNSRTYSPPRASATHTHIQPNRNTEIRVPKSRDGYSRQYSSAERYSSTTPRSGSRGVR